jgi:hypothetical protein
MLIAVSIRPAVLVAIVALTACGGGGSTLGCGGRGCLDLPPPATPCPIVAPVDPTLTLISPPKGATGVPVTIGTIAFSGTFTYASTLVVPRDGTLPLTGVPVTASNGVYNATVPTLRAGVTYDVEPVTAPITVSPGCTFSSTQNAGSFTT